MENVEVNRKIKSKKRYVLAFLIGTFVFLLVFGLTYSVSYLEYQRISDLNQQVSYEIFKDKLAISLFEENVCPLGSFEKLSQDLRFQGQIMDDLEKKFGKTDERVVFRKNFYTLAELEHFEFVKLINKNCNANFDVIFFFYSNEKSDLTSSENAGKVLDSLYNQKPEKLMIYSFDINLEDELISKMKLKYNITESPTILINEKTKIFNPQNIDEISKYLK